MTLKETINNALEWRYAVKKYDKSKKISNEDLEIIKKSIRFSPSSQGIQPYKILIIENSELRAKLLEASDNQNQIIDCSHLLVFCTIKKIDLDYIENMINGIAHVRNQNVEQLNGLKNALIKSTQNHDLDKLKIWFNKQIYIALGFCLKTAAILGIDSTPIEGFNSEKYDEILELDKLNLTSTVLCTLGYRSEEDKYSKLKKWRKDYESVFINL